MERRLAAILAADVVGYARLMEGDEAGTLRRLKALRHELVQPKIGERGGRIVKLMGDGLLAEFPSVVEAVQAAVEIQAAVGEREPDQAEDLRIALRIGINLGDVMVEGSDLYGDGVNIAARLEALAEPGGVCVSGTVFDHVRGKIDLDFTDLGAQRVKNIEAPVRVYALAASDAPAGQPATRAPARERPGKPSIAVLPFTNRSDDPEQDYFSDGITEDIITELGRFGGLTVVARNASFAFKGAAADVTEAGRKLGVHYLVEGSVRRAGKRVRITAQLIDAESGNQVWAERYDRELADIFAVQDEVTRSIVGVLPGRIEVAVAERAARKRTGNMKAYEFLLQGKAVRDSFSAEDTARARGLFEKAIALDPHYAKAHAYLADTYLMDLFMGVAPPDAAQLSLDHARRAMALDSGDIANHDQLGYAYIGAGLWEDAEAQFDRALSRVVVEAEPMTWIGYGLLLLGRAEEACETVREAIRLNPLHPPSFDWVLGQACYFAKRYEEAVRALTGQAMLNAFAYACLAGAYAYLERDREAEATLEAFRNERHREFASRAMAVEPDTVEGLAGSYRRMWRREADWDHLAEGLRKAGLPD